MPTLKRFRRIVLGKPSPVILNSNLAYAAGLESQYFQEVLRANAAQNCSELHSLTTFSLLDAAARRVGKDLDGSVLELGACSNPGLALILLLNGARHIRLNNSGPITNRLSRSYAQNVNFFMQVSLKAKRQLSDLVRIVDEANGVLAVENRWIDIIDNTDAAQLDLPNDSIDFIFSNAVLEHVRSLEAIVAKTYRLLRPGGWCVHLIDLRDHRDFTRPLAFLGMSAAEFAKLDPGVGSQQRHSDYVKAFSTAGFNVLYTGLGTPRPVTRKGLTDMYEVGQEGIDDLFPTVLGSDGDWLTENARATVHSDFMHYSREELAATEVYLICEKAGDASNV